MTALTEKHAETENHVYSCHLDGANHHCLKPSTPPRPSFYDSEVNEYDPNPFDPFDPGPSDVQWEVDPYTPHHGSGGNHTLLPKVKSTFPVERQWWRTALPEK